MNLFIMALIFGAFLYSLLSAFEAYRCPILSSKTKFSLVVLSLLVPIFGPYLSNKKLGHIIDEAGRADLSVNLPFWVALSFRQDQIHGDSSDDLD